MSDASTTPIPTGWRCPCCESVFSPTTETCHFCSPILRLLIRISDPERYAKFETYHTCGEPKE